MLLPPRPLVTGLSAVAHEPSIGPPYTGKILFLKNRSSVVIPQNKVVDGIELVNGKWTAFIQRFSNQWPLKTLYNIA